MANDVIFVPNSGERGRIGATTGVDVHGNKNILTGYYVASGVDATYFGRLGDRNDDIRHYGGDSSSDDGGGGGGGGGGGPTTTTYTVAANGDDGVGSTGYVSYTTNHKNVAYLNTSRTYIQIGAQYEGEETEWDHSVGFFRFDNITAAQGATISSAYLKPYKMSFVGSAVNPDINFKIGALDQDDPAAPSSASDLQGHIGQYTTAEALWDHDTLRAESNSSELTSPDLKDVIQEIVNRSGWSSGNAIVIVMYLNNAAFWPTYTGGTTNYVNFESYDNTNSNPAKLEITI